MVAHIVKGNKVAKIGSFITPLFIYSSFYAAIKGMTLVSWCVGFGGGLISRWLSGRKPARRTL